MNGNDHRRPGLAPRLRGWCGVALVASLIGGCAFTKPVEKGPAPRRDINVVLAENDKRLMALSGVVGVYVGLLDDDRTPCLKVMIVKDDPQVRRSIPPVIEGYRVVAEVTGEIKPLAPRQP